MQSGAEQLEVAEVELERGLSAGGARLSEREIHILKEVAGGFGNKQIAWRLGISEKTVRNHLTRVFAKLKASNRTEAVVKAMRLGLQIV